MQGWNRASNVPPAQTSSLATCQRTGGMVILCTDGKMARASLFCRRRLRLRRQTQGPRLPCPSASLPFQPKLAGLSPKSCFLQPPAQGVQRAPGASSGPPFLPCPHIVSSWAWQLRLRNTFTSQHLQSSPWARPPSPLTGPQLLALPLKPVYRAAKEALLNGPLPCLYLLPLPSPGWSDPVHLTGQQAWPAGNDWGIPTPYLLGTL